jgi:hypothetical protein
LRIDEQESTRFLLLSPEVNESKIRQGITEKIRKDADASAYIRQLNDDPQRQHLIKRIKAIRQEEISEIRIGDPTKLKEMFMARHKRLKPRHQRDIGRIIALTKSLALLNLWFRKREKSTIITNNEDLLEAFVIWDKISVSQELNLPPYIYNLYTEVILEAWYNKNPTYGEQLNTDVIFWGLSRQEIMQKHFDVYGRPLPDWQLRQQILPMLQTAGLIIEEPDPEDKRKMLVFVSAASSTDEHTNSESGAGVMNTEELAKDSPELAAWIDEMTNEEASS